MNITRATLTITLLATLAACGEQRGFVTRASTSNGPLLTADAPQGPASPEAAQPPAYRITAVDVNVPTTLKVSEANSYKPNADIVWREDPAGDRYTQVGKIVTDALEEGVAGMNGPRAVKIEARLVRFHALTPLTRYTVPDGLATHNVKMMMSLVDAKTGEVVVPAHEVGFNIEAHTGAAALLDESQGISQKARITAALVKMIHEELDWAPGQTIADTTGTAQAPAPDPQA